MNNEYYKQVLEDVQNDLAEVEQTVSELHGIERYVQRKMETDGDEGNSKLTYDQYQALLDDVRQDVDGARSKIGELRGVGNFAREKLKAAGVDVDELQASFQSAAKADSGSTSQDQSQSASGKEPEAQGDSDESTREEKSPVKSGNVDSSQTVEFGPDGFPMAK